MNYDNLNTLLRDKYPSHRSIDGINWFRLAAEMKVSNTGIKLAVTKKSLNLFMLERLADVLNTTVVDLIAGNIPPAPIKTAITLTEIDKKLDEILLQLKTINMRQ